MCKELGIVVRQGLERIYNYFQCVRVSTNNRKGEYESEISSGMGCLMGKS